MYLSLNTKWEWVLKECTRVFIIYTQEIKKKTIYLKKELWAFKFELCISVTAPFIVTRLEGILGIFGSKSADKSWQSIFFTNNRIRYKQFD